MNSDDVNGAAVARVDLGDGDEDGDGGGDGGVLYIGWLGFERWGIRLAKTEKRSRIFHSLKKL